MPRIDFSAAPKDLIRFSSNGRVVLVRSCCGSETGEWFAVGESSVVGKIELKLFNSNAALATVTMMNALESTNE